MELTALLILIPPPPPFFPNGLNSGITLGLLLPFVAECLSVHLHLCPVTQGCPLCFDFPPLEETILSMTFLDIWELFWVPLREECLLQ